jgi:hypothetical protein
VTNTNCGVRVVQGGHRAQMTGFIRELRPGGGAAAAPANLGFRLVVEDERWPALHRIGLARRVKDTRLELKTARPEEF